MGSIMTSRNQAKRAAFTLVELLVVIALILILAALGVAFLPAIGDTARQARAATDLQQFILTVKQKALRDQVPTGIRLIPSVDPVTGYVKVHQCQVIQQPDDFAVSPVSSNPAADGKLSATKLSHGVAINVPYKGQIGPGDYLEVLGCGLMSKINSAGPYQVGKTQLILNNPLPINVQPTLQYRIVRAPRLTGDEPLDLPDGVIIDTDTNNKYNNLLPASAYPTSGVADIVFAPSGEVISSGVTTDSINLWVRDFKVGSNGIPLAANPTDGQQTIIAIFVRSGLTAAHPPAPGNDPYAFILDGRTSGK
jgi:prepilin-type N-terminal cleavage/methylation domain-containing protein